MKTAIATILTLLVAVSLGGCLVPESKLHEYKDHAERLRVELDTQIPTDLLYDEPTFEGEVREGAQHGPGGEPSSPAWWQVRHYRTLVDSPGTSEQAAQALHEHLTGEGWQHARERGEPDDIAVGDGYRRDDEDGEQWYIQIIWVETTPDRVENLRLLIVSPMTVLGADPPESVWSEHDG